MTICQRCRRPLKTAASDGYGPKCRAKLDPAKAESAVLRRLAVELDIAVHKARGETAAAFFLARHRLGMWP